MRGDIVCHGENPWVVIKQSEITVDCSGLPVIPIRKWPAYSIFLLDTVTNELKSLLGDA